MLFSAGTMAEPESTAVSASNCGPAVTAHFSGPSPEEFLLYMQSDPPPSAATKCSFLTKSQLLDLSIRLGS